MNSEIEPLIVARLAAQRGRLQEWLVENAYPLWASSGVDISTGAFHEALDLEGAPIQLPRRVRVQPRQVFAFSRAAAVGWRGNASSLVSRGIEVLRSEYRRPDGLYRALVGADGSAIDDSAVLYDQAFVLLGFASAVPVLDAGAEMEQLALSLRARIHDRWRAYDGSFLSGDKIDVRRRDSNPHMHLLEACLAWAQVGSDSEWIRWVDELADLAIQRFIVPETGALVESLADDWTPLPSQYDSRVEPGHQYEWAWLLMHCQNANWVRRYAAALRLIEVAEARGVRSGYAINSLNDDLTPRDGDSRLWPQTERIKAACLAGKLTGDERYYGIAAQAVASVFRYLDTAVPGLWFDLRLADGRMAESAVPASTFYHLVGAIRALAGRTF